MGSREPDPTQGCPGPQTAKQQLRLKCRWEQEKRGREPGGREDGQRGSVPSWTPAQDEAEHSSLGLVISGSSKNRALTPDQPLCTPSEFSLSTTPSNPSVRVEMGRSRRSRDCPRHTVR